eukprot:TRINITY_DN2895_c0_g1_i2.p1 TRINITY_DN2895_c0_g1~~TRINITY_DN2895_c0_g1_i2.p1  ORF type:complete len:333 (-),score=108.33 TRINITY_DN2895_c0_g1_i2:66-1064(-)
MIVSWFIETVSISVPWNRLSKLPWLWNTKNYELDEDRVLETMLNFLSDLQTLYIDMKMLRQNDLNKFTLYSSVVLVVLAYLGTLISDFTFIYFLVAVILLSPYIYTYTNDIINIKNTMLLYLDDLRHRVDDSFRINDLDVQHKFHGEKRLRVDRHLHENGPFPDYEYDKVNAYVLEDSTSSDDDDINLNENNMSSHSSSDELNDLNEEKNGSDELFDDNSSSYDDDDYGDNNNNDNDDEDEMLLSAKGVYDDENDFDDEIFEGEDEYPHEEHSSDSQGDDPYDDGDHEDDGDDNDDDDDDDDDDDSSSLNESADDEQDDESQDDGSPREVVK